MSVYIYIYIYNSLHLYNVSAFLSTPSALHCEGGSPQPSGYIFMYVVCMYFIRVICSQESKCEMSWAMQKHSKTRGSHWKREVFRFCQISWLCVLQGWVLHSPQLRLFHLGETMTHPWWEILHIHNVVLILLLSPVIDGGTGQANKHQGYPPSAMAQK